MSEPIALAAYTVIGACVFAASFLLTMLSNHFQNHVKPEAKTEQPVEDDWFDDHYDDEYEYNADRTIMFRKSAMGKRITNRPEPTRNPDTIYRAEGRTEFGSFEWWK